MTILWSFSYNFFVKFYNFFVKVEKFGSGEGEGGAQHSHVTCIYPNPCYNEVCQKETELYLDVRLFIFTESASVHSVLKFKFFRTLPLCINCSMILPV